MDPKQARIIFMGTPEFAVESLKALVENGYKVVGVITAPDKPAGRGLKVAEAAVKKYAAGRGLPVLQPEKLKNQEFLDHLRLLKPDLQVVVAFRMLPEVVWNLPPLGTFNLHASLLPQYRGAAPLNWVLINGETESGVTTFLLSHEIDTGRIIFQEKEPIFPDDSVGDLHDRLMVQGARLVLKTVDALARGECKPVGQEEMPGSDGQLKTAPKLTRESTQIRWNWTAEKIRNLIRGLSPYPAAWTLLHLPQGKQTEMKIFRAQTGDPVGSVSPGTLRTDGKSFLAIACSDRWLHISNLQLAGKKRMNAEEFLRGFHEPENQYVE